VRAFVESCRYPFQTTGIDASIPTPVARMQGAAGGRERAKRLGLGTRGRGSEADAGAIWGINQADYFQRCDPWPLNPKGELLLGVKLESPEGIANADAILAVPGIGMAEMGPGDLSLALGYMELQRDPYPPEMQAARDKVFAACRKNGVAFLEGCSPTNIAARLDEGVRVISGGTEQTAKVGRAHSKRSMPV
jgi:4-hydroxy-2-oxoheptanedioate aldolase